MCLSRSVGSEWSLNWTGWKVFFVFLCVLVFLLFILCFVTFYSILRGPFSFFLNQHRLFKWLVNSKFGAEKKSNMTKKYNKSTPAFKKEEKKPEKYRPPTINIFYVPKRLDRTTQIKEKKTTYEEKAWVNEWTKYEKKMSVEIDLYSIEYKGWGAALNACGLQISKRESDAHLTINKTTFH